MARMWRERLDPTRHRDYMGSGWIGGLPAQAPRDKLLPAWAYFVHAGSFTFEFHSIEQIQECLEYFSRKMHPSTREPGHELEHYWQRWYERLPTGLTRTRKRLQIVKALQRATQTFEQSADS